MFRHPQGCILFDWGDTLMRDFTEFSGPMKDWPRLEAIPGAAATLAVLHPDWTLALATNAADSYEKDIRLALQRVALARWLDKIYCFREIGLKKPSLAFFQYILDDLKLNLRSICIVGDNYETDVLGANACGMRAVWFNPHSLELRETDLQRTIHDLIALPACLNDFM
jgi:FMN phosphatase YigB (HAD superfamily)